jgi:type IV pilus assembly protein PilX
MRGIRIKSNRLRRFTEKGIALFVALIALLVMSLAAVALIRSVDTNTMIAGNLAFRQAALVASDRGAESALVWMDGKLVANVDDLNNHIPAEGYFATYVADCTGAQDPNGNEIDAIYLVDNCGVLSHADDGLGNEIRYVIQRMCFDPSSPLPYEADESTCLLGEAEIGTSSKKVKDRTRAGMVLDAKQSPLYRVTVKVTGPRNTVSYAQTFVY